MALLSATDIAEIKATINEIVQDTSINTTVKYRQFVGDNYYDPKDQQWASPYSDWSGVSALIGLITKDEMATEGTEKWDTRFVIMQSSVSGTVSVSDKIVNSGTTYNIFKVNSDPLSVVYTILAKAV